MGYDFIVGRIFRQNIALCIQGRHSIRTDGRSLERYPFGDIFFFTGKDNNQVVRVVFAHFLQFFFCQVFSCRRIQYRFRDIQPVSFKVFRTYELGTSLCGVGRIRIYLSPDIVALLACFFKKLNSQRPISVMEMLENSRRFKIHSIGNDLISAKDEFIGRNPGTETRMRRCDTPVLGSEFLCLIHFACRSSRRCISYGDPHTKRTPVKPFFDKRHNLFFFFRSGDFCRPV